MDHLTKEQRAKQMSLVHSSKTRLEDKVANALWHKGFRFRKNVSTLIGKPDLAIKKYKIVIFVDSCFWHNCSDHCRMPKSNIEYWKKKLTRNKNRDIFVTEFYKEKEWNLIRVWEHDLKGDFEKTIDQVAEHIQSIIHFYKSKSIKSSS